jgi:myosin-crossreactive antigen
MVYADSTSNPSVVRSSGADQSTAEVYLVGGGIASLAAAVFMIRGGDIPCLIWSSP